MFLVVSCTIAAMKELDRKRLADAVVDRRVELKMLTTKALADAADLSSRMLGDVENGRRENFSRGAKAQIERALRWAPKSIDSILAGGHPTPLPEDPAPPEPQPSEHWASHLYRDIDNDGLNGQALAIKSIGDRIIGALRHRSADGQVIADVASDLAQLAADLADALFTEVEEHPELQSRYAEGYTAGMLATRHFLLAYDELVPEADRMADRYTNTMRRAFGFFPGDATPATPSPDDPTVPDGAVHGEPDRVPGEPRRDGDPIFSAEKLEKGPEGKRE